MSKGIKRCLSGNVNFMGPAKKDLVDRLVDDELTASLFGETVWKGILKGVSIGEMANPGHSWNNIINSSEYILNSARSGEYLPIAAAAAIAGITCHAIYDNIQTVRSVVGYFRK